MLSNLQGIKAPNTIIKLWQTLMCDLSCDVNNTPKKLLSLKTRAEIDVGHTIDYDVKAYQIKTTIVKFTRVRQKILNLNRP